MRSSTTTVLLRRLFTPHMCPLSERPASCWGGGGSSKYYLESCEKILRGRTILKVHLREIFYFKLVWPKEPIWAPDFSPKVFLILSSNSPRHSNFIVFPVLSIYAKFHSAYYPYMINFIPRIISMRTISFRVLSANAKFFLKSNTNSAYSQYALNFTPRFLSIRWI